MAKMFYTIEEVCGKLGKTEDEVKEMARSGLVQEFRDREKLMFKVDQIDLLVGGDDDTGEVHLELEDTSGGSGLDLASSGLDLNESGLGLEESREDTGISIFDTDHGLADSGGGSASDQTRGGDLAAASGTGDDELSLESVGSGSGLLDLTRESDDTSLGAELLEEVYSSDENIEIPAAASGLFEAATEEAPGEQLIGAAPMAAVPMMVDSYDGSGSGLGMGLLVGALAALVCVAIIIIVSVLGGTPELAKQMTSSTNTLYMWSGGLLGGTLLLGAVGWFIGKATE